MFFMKTIVPMVQGMLLMRKVILGRLIITLMPQAGQGIIIIHIADILPIPAVTAVITTYSPTKWCIAGNVRPKRCAAICKPPDTAA